MSALGDEHEPSMEDLAEAMRQLEVGQFLLSMVSTLTALVYGKIEQGELGQAKTGIDAIAALIPVLRGQVEGELQRSFERALADLQVAYAAASSAPAD